MHPIGAEPSAKTFLFTDIVGSTSLWELEPTRMGAAVHASEVLQTLHVEANAGTVFKNTGDGLAASFDLPSDAVHAAGAIQLAVADLEWDDGGLNLRIGLHTGQAEVRSGDYFGGAVNLAARVMSTAVGGQILTTEPTATMAGSRLRPSFSLRYVGEAWLRGFGSAHRLFQLEHPDLESEFPRLAQRAAIGRSLPNSATNFIGRRSEIAEIITALNRGRLVSLVGPAGVGKSRLALEVARRMLDRHADGSVWCALEPVETPEQAIHVIVAALDVLDTSTHSLEDIIDHLAERHLLLILDNCEHVMPTIRQVVSRISETCPNTVVLATSQEALRLPGEVVHIVEPLESADGQAADDAAIELFIDRALSTGARIDTTASGRRQIGELCHRLDGLPLAIELAAARVRTMTLVELEHALDERFSILASRVRGPVRSERHQTLYNAVRWSYELLSDDERTIFEVLGVFRGGAHLDAVVFVADRIGINGRDARELLWELVEKSLVRPDTEGSTTRYTMLSSLREFASDRLMERGLLGQAQAAHAAYYLRFAEEAEEQRAGPDERIWVEGQLREFDNLRSAVADAESTGDLDTTLRIYVALNELASMQGRVEVFDWVDPAADIDSGHELVPAALAMSGLRHDPLKPVSLETAEAAIRLFEQHGGRRHRILMFARGFAESSRRNRLGALRAYEETVEVIRETEGLNGRWINARGLVAMFGQDVDTARQLVVDARGVAQPTGISFALIVLARALQPEHPVEALRLIEEASDLAAKVYNRHVSVYVDLTAGGVLAQGAEPAAALADPLRALQSAVDLRQHDVMWRSVGDIADVLKQSEHDKEAGDFLRPWIRCYPEGRAPAAHRFRIDVGTADEDESHAASASFEYLVEHSHDVLAGVLTPREPGSWNPSTNFPEEQRNVL